MTLLFFFVNGFSILESYDYGYQCGLQGADALKVSSLTFLTEKHRQVWEQGKADAQAGRPAQTGAVIYCHQCGATELSFCHHEEELENTFSKSEGEFKMVIT